MDLLLEFLAADDEGRPLLLQLVAGLRECRELRLLVRHEDCLLFSRLRQPSHPLGLLNELCAENGLPVTYV